MQVRWTSEQKTSTLQVYQRKLLFLFVWKLRVSPLCITLGLFGSIWNIYFLYCASCWKEKGWEVQGEANIKSFLKQIAVEFFVLFLWTVFIRERERKRNLPSFFSKTILNEWNISAISCVGSSWQIRCILLLMKWITTLDIHCTDGWSFSDSWNMLPSIHLLWWRVTGVEIFYFIFNSRRQWISSGQDIQKWRPERGFSKLSECFSC